MLKVLCLCVLSAFIAVAAWQPWGHPSLALLVIIPWAMCRTRWQAFSAALAYYAASMTDLTVITARFFELGAAWGPVAGLCAWLAWAAVLAATQALPYTPHRRWRPFGVLGGLVLTVIPPVGWFSVVSPLNALGYWFPGASWWGIPLGILLILKMASTAVEVDRALTFASHAEIQKSWISGFSWIGLAVFVALALALNVVCLHSPQPPAGWVAVNTHLGVLGGGQLKALQRAEELNRIIAQQKSIPGTKVLVLPEMAIGEWRPRTAFWLEESIQATETQTNTNHDVGFSWISGAGLQDTDKHDLVDAKVNGVVLVSGKQTRPIPGRIPMPLAMWRPGGYAAHPWSAPVFELDGQRATVSICYEDLLPWAQLQSYWQNPTVHLSLSSLWFAQDLNVGSIQERSAKGWAQMFGVPMLRAVNH